MFNDGLENRVELAKEFGRAGFSRGAEIGVFRGQYSIVLFENIPALRLYCVDPWTPSRNHRSARHLEGHYKHTQEILKPYDAVFMRMTSMEGAKQIPDESLDFVYIDALHDYPNVIADLDAWVPKVRKGGVVSGHDWTHPGVTLAVKEFVALHEVDNCYATKLDPAELLPSWYWVKSD